MKAVKYVLMLPVFFMGILVLYVIFTLLNQAIWDARVRQLCSSEGGVTVYERVDLNSLAYAGIPTTPSGAPFLPYESEKTSEDPLYIRSTITADQKFGDITVTRFEQSIIRASDRKALSTKISFSRRGGDAVTLGPDSAFSCDHIPDRRTSLLETTFNLQG